ncbi:FecR family protein [Sphingobacterium haloxyli]|uniref:Anti-sigma factor n=1 Tax=Sphingobacterium haloxyli TaxID=2100533 RepID=A0A2S9J475_9SPHI|nr:FecR family protein [Sphingobacterium haloxyli]PRD47550.1 hypothetical protein C5745_09530 [Sphingobacterium haloxyli]
MKAISKIARLIKRYMDGELTPEERIVLEQWRGETPENEAFFKSLTEGDEIFEDGLSWIQLEQEEGEDWLRKLKERTLKRASTAANTGNRSRRLYFIYFAAAAVLLIAGFFSYFRLSAPVVGEEVSLSSIQAGTNKAKLVLSDGKEINLRSDKDGIILDNQLSYADGTPLLVIDKNRISHIKATIHVPKGGKYKVTLSDGSKVWLNAQSTLVYPLQFDSRHRKVTLEGEAYFEVAPVTDDDQVVPFEVICRNQKILVTGTAFNVSAYADDIRTVTTLVEGSVSIESGHQKVHLVPNQQVISSTAGNIIKKEVDVQPFVAWKDNKFLFYETELRDLMKSISRWYAIDVSYQDQISPTYFYGEIDRDKNLAEALRIIEKSGVKFTLRKSGKTSNLIIIKE